MNGEMIRIGAAMTMEEMVGNQMTLPDDAAARRSHGGLSPPTTPCYKAKHESNPTIGDTRGSHAI